MNLKQLEYFVAVAECLNFTKAAKRCFVSQTAITLQIQSLESKLGVPLLLRDKHHVELTAAGKVYLGEAKQILNQAEEASKKARRAAAGFSGSITIGFMKGYEQSRFPKTLWGFREEYPNIAVHLLRENMTRLYSRLLDGECDISFNLSPYFQSYPDLTRRHLKDYPMKAILYPAHPLASREHLLYSDLAKENIIIMQPKGRPLDETEEAMLCYKRGGFVPNIIACEPDIETMLLMISAGMGVAFLPEYAVRSHSNSRSVNIIPLEKEDGSPETLAFELNYRSDNMNPALEKFIQWMNERNLIPAQESTTSTFE